MEFQDILNQFLATQEARNNSERTLEWYQYMIGSYQAFLERHSYTGPDLLKPSVIEAFLNEGRAAGLSDATLHGRYRALRAFYHWLEEREWIPEGRSPFNKLAGPRRAKKPPRRARPVEVASLLESISSQRWTDLRDRAIIQVLACTGLRLSELAALEIPDVSLRQRLLLVHKGKGNKSRVVPFNADVTVAVDAWFRVRPYWSAPILWLSDNGYGGVRGQLTADGVRQMLNRRCDNAGLRRLNPHSFRHGAGMNLIRAGADLTFVRDYLGHSDVKITAEFYIQWTDEEEFRRRYDDILRKEHDNHSG